jgi:hypothetical protein
MTSDDAEYYRGRAVAELGMARAATNPYARRAHQELAENYAILCRLLCAPSVDDAAPAPEIAREEVGFVNLIQALAHPHGAELFHPHGGPADPALFEELRLAEPERPRLAVPLADPALIWP